jgi:hypothetical protein
MREYLSLLVDSTLFEDDAAPGYLINPLTDQLMEFDAALWPHRSDHSRGVRQATGTRPDEDWPIRQSRGQPPVPCRSRTHPCMRRGLASHLGKPALAFSGPGQCLWPITPAERPDRADPPPHPARPRS